jgi:hypothetical protein
MAQIPEDNMEILDGDLSDEMESSVAMPPKEIIPEGMEISDELEMHNYPLDSLLIRSETRSVHEVCRRIGQGLYIMDPDFQRDFIWKSEKQSRLIESLLMRIPLPVFYFAERDDGKVIVIDGLQRLTTISNFLNNAFALRHLDQANMPFYGKYFKDLPVKLQTRLEDTPLIIYILDEKVPERARLDIFERVNGGMALSRQQMRNCMYCGPSTRMLAELAKEMTFLKATGRSLSWQTMRDREFINRFIAFYLLGVSAYKGDMDQFLADALIKVNTFSKENITDLKKKFRLSMETCYAIWGDHCFRKHTPDQTARNVINAALYDVLSTKMADFPSGMANAKKECCRQALFTLFSNSEFMHAITSSTNSLKQVSTRFTLVDEAFQEI